MDEHISRDAIRKRKERERETPEKQETRREKDRSRKKQRINDETKKQREKRLKYQCIKSKQRRDIVIEQNLNTNRNIRESDDHAQQVFEQPIASEFSTTDRWLLEKFRNEIGKLHHVFCPICKECCPSIELVQGKCRRCYSETIMPHKFSVQNNMDPGDVPDELQGLTEIEEMLIAKVFTVMSVYRLRGGQYGYKGNVINFPQDVKEFTTRLPREPSSLEVLIVRRHNESNLTAFSDFIVRRAKVARALQWLKVNNDYYKDIDIDDKVLQTLPENGSIVEQLPQILNNQTNEDLDDINDAEKGYDEIARTFVPYLPLPPRENVAIDNTLDRMQNKRAHTIWPQIDNNPINEFQTSGYMTMAFPTLYPTGKADLRSGRLRKVMPAEYFKHLLKYKDGRFGRHTRWRYFALNSQMRWRALQEGQIYVKQKLNEDELTVADIQEKIAAGDKYMADRIMQFGEGLRGSRQFWKARRSELSDMIKQLGSQGMIFFTFSSADLHWPELHKLMPKIENSERNELMKIRHKNLVENPHTVAWFFNKRFKTFFENVLKKKWDLEDFWYRYEWQHRGSVHVHGIGKKRDGPKIEWEQLKEDQNAVDNLAQYMNTLVTTINPGLDFPVPEMHPCQKNHNELRDDMQDYIELINKLQRHTRCRPSYCLRVDRTGQQICRFGYPKEISHHTYVRDDGRGQPELITARNDPLINPHSRLQLQGWRANVDLKPVLTIYAALQYISKYASKAETRSGGFSEIYNQILCESNSNDTSLNSVQKLLLHSVSERDISAQETCHLLLGLPLYHSSRSFVSLNLNKEAPRLLCDAGNNDAASAIENDVENDVVKTTKSVLRKYWDRPIEFEEISLFQLNLKYKFTKGNWNRCIKENIVRVWPRPSPIYQGPQWEEFCRVKVILHVPHRSFEQLTEDGTITWPILYERFTEIINSNPVDLLGLPVDNEKETTEEEDDLDDIEDELNDEYRSDWMLLAEMGPNAIIDHPSDLGNRDMDRQHDWLNDWKQYYNDSDVLHANNFLQKAIVNEKDKDENLEYIETIDYQTLNGKQAIIFERIKSHYQNILINSHTDPLRIIIMGTAGTGKSYLIKALRSMFHEKVGSESKIPLLVLAPTGVAAFNIKGKTIHSALSIPIFNGVNNNHLDIKGESLKRLQEKLENIKYVIIDEKSMVGRRMLGMIDIRLRQAFPEHNNEPFGGRSIILFGDFGQLPPVLDLPMYLSAQRDPLSNDGFAAYRQFKEVYKLDIIERQSGDSENQQKFREILLRLRDGESTIADWEELTVRSEEKQSLIERDKFNEATLILPTWDKVNTINIEKLRSLNQPIAKIKAVHTGGSEAKNANSDTAKGLEPQLLLAKGACIMLTANLWTKVGLVNGSIGYVQDIIFNKEGPPYLPSIIFIKFDNYQGPTISALDGTKVVPILPIQRIWESKNGKICSRLQFPICLAWAITTHKSQGLTLEKAIIDLGEREFAAGLSFVATSRVRSLEDLLFKPFSYERLQRIKNCKRLQERKEEENRLLLISYNRVFSQ